MHFTPHKSYTFISLSFFFCSDWHICTCIISHIIWVKWYMRCSRNEIIPKQCDKVVVFLSISPKLFLLLFLSLFLWRDRFLRHKMGIRISSQSEQKLQRLRLGVLGLITWFHRCLWPQTHETQGSESSGWINSVLPLSLPPSQTARHCFRKALRALWSHNYHLYKEIMCCMQRWEPMGCKLKSLGRQREPEE